MKNALLVIIALLISQISFGQLKVNENRTIFMGNAVSESFLHNPQNAKVQTMIQEGKQWSTLVSSIVNPMCPDPEGTEITVLQGDSVINGKTYKKVYSTSREDLSALRLLGVTRQEGERVYYMDVRDKEEQLFFDFGLKKGDSFTFHDLPCKVIADGDTVINGVSRKMLTVECYGQTDKWMEGIGSLVNGLFFNYLMMDGVGHSLLCCHEGEKLLYMNPDYNDCYIRRGSFIGDGTKWTELSYRSYQSGFGPLWRETHYELREGRFIGFEYYWALYQNGEQIGLMREDRNRNIYLRDWDSGYAPNEFLLYSFTQPWVVGDSIRYARFYSDFEIYKSTVSNVGSILLDNGETVPVVHNIMYGVGSMDGIIKGISPTPTNGSSHTLLKYFRRGELIYQNDNVVSISSTQAEGGLLIDDTDEGVSFTLSEADARDALLTVYSLSGQKIGQYPLLTGTVTVKGLSAGMYFYHVENSRSFSGKFIVK